MFCMEREKLRKEIQKGRIVIGAKRTIKFIMNGKIKKVVIAKNCPEDLRNRIIYYSKIFEIELEEFDGDNKELGIFCGKPFSISVLGILHG